MREECLVVLCVNSHVNRYLIITDTCTVHMDNCSSENVAYVIREEAPIPGNKLAITRTAT